MVGKIFVFDELGDARIRLSWDGVWIWSPSFWLERLNFWEWNPPRVRNLGGFIQCVKCIINSHFNTPFDVPVEDCYFWKIGSRFNSKSDWTLSFAFVQRDGKFFKYSILLRHWRFRRGTFSPVANLRLCASYPWNDRIAVCRMVFSQFMFRSVTKMAFASSSLLYKLFILSSISSCLLLEKLLTKFSGSEFRGQCLRELTNGSHFFWMDDWLGRFENPLEAFFQHLISFLFWRCLRIQQMPRPPHGRNKAKRWWRHNFGRLFLNGYLREFFSLVSKVSSSKLGDFVYIFWRALNTVLLYRLAICE